MIGEEIGEASMSGVGLGDGQKPRRILVEPMDKAWPWSISSEGIEQAVDVFLGAGAALGGEARRLVEHDGSSVLRQDHGFGLRDLVFA